MAKHLIDTDLYVDLLRTGDSHTLIAELYANETPGIYFSSVVAQELLAGVLSRKSREVVQSLIRPFERAGRMVTPGHREWKETGDVLAIVLRRRPDLRDKIPSLVNDCLLAMSARTIGAHLYTRNQDDFTLLRTIRRFSLTVVV